MFTWPTHNNNKSVYQETPKWLSIKMYYGCNKDNIIMDGLFLLKSFAYEVNGV